MNLGQLCLLATVVLSASLISAASVPAYGSPIGITYRPFLDAPVMDAGGNLAGETHRTLAGITFDGIAEASVQNLVLSAPPGSSFINPPRAVYYDEAETAIASGSLLDFWVLGDINDSSVPLITNAVDTDSTENVFFGIEGLYWVGTFASQGDKAMVVNSTFMLGFADGSSLPLSAVSAGVVFGSGTEDSPLIYFAEFDAGDFGGNPTELHAVLEIKHIPEPTSLWLGVLGALGLFGRRLQKGPRS